MTTLMLIDGNSLTYRAFFALPTDMATASGQVTNAVFGFTSMLVNLIRDHRPDHLAVIAPVREAVRHGRWAVLVNPESPQQCDDAMRTLRGTHAELMRSA